MPQDPHIPLQDNNGNTLASIFVNANGDIELEHTASGESVRVDADGLHASSIDTESIDSGGDFSAGSVITLVEGLNSNTRGGQFDTQTKDGVSTSAVDIYRLPTSRSGALIEVVGQDASASQNMFIDTVVFVRGAGTVTVIDSTSIGASSRTYGQSGQNLELTMGSGTYQVSVAAVVGVFPSP